MLHPENAPADTAPLRVWRVRQRELDLASRPLVMGIVNVTPDSFSDGGRFGSTELAVAHALQLAEEGADILDIGGESTRPGASAVSLEEEIGRVVPVVAELVKRTRLPLSIDTSKAEVARRCLDLGAEILNDVTALQGDPEMLQVVARSGAGVVLMHMQGTPRTMQQNPHYDDVVGNISAFLKERLAAAVAAGIDRSCITLDPGLGFGKTVAHNLEILSRLPEFQHLGQPICLGVSRKSFLGKVLGRPVEQRQAGSLAAACFAVAQSGAQVLRVHDVAATRDAVVLWQAIQQSRAG